MHDGERQEESAMRCYSRNSCYSHYGCSMCFGRIGGGDVRIICIYAEIVVPLSSECACVIESK